MTEDREKLLERMRKVAALTTSPNEGEAAAAMEKLHELCAIHNIDVDELADKGGQVRLEDDIIVQDSSTLTPSLGHAWERVIRNASAKLCFCGYFYQHDYSKGYARNGSKRQDRHIFIGKRHNIMSAMVMSDYLIRTSNRLAEEATAQQPRELRNRYYMGFLNGISERLAVRLYKRYVETKQKPTQSATGGRNLPALMTTYQANEAAIKSYMERHHSELGKARKRQAQEGREDGFRAGDTVSLDPQIDAQKRNNLRIGGR